jgi:predicted nucleic acid-binding protein
VGQESAIIDLVPSKKIDTGEHAFLLTPALFLEYEDVLKRPERLLGHGLKIEEVDRFLAILAGLCRPVEVNYRWRPQLADAADEMVIEAAVNGRAEALVTFNVRHFLPAAGLFGLAVMTPGEVLRRMKQ